MRYKDLSFDIRIYDHSSGFTPYRSLYFTRYFSLSSAFSGAMTDSTVT